MKNRKLTPLGVTIKKKLVEMGMTQKELADKIGTSDVYLNMILFGERSGEKYMPALLRVMDIEENKQKGSKGRRMAI